MLQGKKILLGITGSIAAYKAIVLTRLLVKNGAEVKVILTPAAKDFVSSLTLSTLTKNKVLVHLADEDTWSNHVMLGRWADVMLIAPLTVNTLAKLAQGSCDNLLLAAYLSATCPVVVAPAMDEDMWLHPSTRKNIESITQYGNQVIPVNNGELGSGLYGEGRMAEPEEIISYLTENFFRSSFLKGKKFLVSAGPTYELIDPVRFIGNFSSGKMGFALAEELYMQGAEVVLVSGPTNLKSRYKGIQIINVVSAKEMLDACQSTFTTCDVAIMAAAVADYTPVEVSDIKIKKQTNDMILPLIKTVDILKSLGETKKTHQFLVGFALETNNENENALKKLHSKNADLIVLNSLNETGAGFGLDSNKITIFDQAGTEHSFGPYSKQLIAQDIIGIVVKHIL